MTENISILVIDDVEKVVEGLESNLSLGAASFKLNKYIVKKHRKKSSIIDDIVQLVKQHQITHIISDRGFAIIEYDETKQIVTKKDDYEKIDNIICAVISNLKTDEIKKIQSLIIYTYDPFTVSIRRELRELREKIAKTISDKIVVNDKLVYSTIKTIETSSIYRRPGKTGIYPNGLSKKCVIGSYDTCRFYGKFLADVLENVIETDNSKSERISPYSYSKPQNYEMLKQIRSFEDFINPKSFSVGTVSCYGNIYGELEYLVDVPFKKYFGAINDFIDKNELNTIFFKELDKTKEFVKYEWVYFKYDVYLNDKIFVNELDIKLSSGLEQGCFEIFKKWLSLLHSSIFYCEENSWNWEKSLMNIKPVTNPISNVTIFFPIISLNEADFLGTFNFTLYSENINNNFNTVELFAFEKYAALISSKLFELILPHKSKEVNKQATKAAISEIINRNMAHHISSHVSNRATLDVVLKRLNLKFSDLSEPENYHTILDLLNRFNQYRDERSEYLTYITHFSSPVSAFLYRDVVQPLIENTLLMDNIAANENINYTGTVKTDLLTNKLKIIVQKKKEKGEVKSIFVNYPVEGQTKYTSKNLPYFRKKLENGFEYEAPILEGGPDIEVSLPGSLGKHALYSILENFIRNSAKHGSDAKNKGLDIILLLSDLDNEDAIKVTLTDNCTFAEERTVTNEQGERKVFDIYDKIGEGRKLKITKDFNGSIQTPILEKKDLGLIDMKVNACLLAGLEITDAYCKKALTAVTIEGKLAYEFHIARPKKAVFIGEFCKGKTEKDGFFYYSSVAAFKKATISKSFQFAVLSDKVYDESYSKIASELPARVLKQSNIDIEKVENIEYLYEAWLEKLRGKDKANIHIYFYQSEGTSPTKEFLEVYNDNKHLKIYPDELLQKTTSINGNKNILFDRHGGLISKFDKGKSFIDTNNSWILIDKNNPDFDYIARYDIRSKPKLLPYELEEAGLLKVLIIDERVAEQSMRSLSNDNDALKLTNERFDFEKFDIKDEPNLTLFDTAWAANIFLATHLNGNPLKGEINPLCQHQLNVTIEEGSISFETNITSSYATTIENANWQFQNQEIKTPILQEVNVKPDFLIIHRTKLKELIASYNKQRKLPDNSLLFITQLMEINKNLNIVVTTGSGTTHGIDGNYKILPFSTLMDLILGKRIQKLRLSKLILQLTKNKV